MASPLLHFLSQARSTLLRPSASTPPIPLTLVLGNPSCDLDSFISATVFSFLYSQASSGSRSARLFVPLLNLPSTPASELWRLRPEFGTALRLAVNGLAGDDEREDADRSLLGSLVTISDIRSSSSSPLHKLFTKSTTTNPPQKTSVILVDHNVLSIPIVEIPPSAMALNFEILGCIDHHIDENSVPSTAHPRLIRTGIGSCTTLVVQHLRDEGIWPESMESTGQSNEMERPAAVELAILSLASILIDTANLTAEGKVSKADRDVVSFLEDIISNAMAKEQVPLDSSSNAQRYGWDRDSFYGQVSSSKANSLDLLTLPEIFYRDYKTWSEKTGSTGKELKLGIASLVKPINWLIEKTDSSSPEKFITAMQNFASGQELDLFSIMTTSTNREGQFRRELLVMASGKAEEPRRVVDSFGEASRDELNLDEWNEDGRLVDLLRAQDIKGKVWWHRDVSKSRKQVAPLLRETMRSV